MKKTFLFLSFLSIVLFAEVKDINIDKNKEVSEKRFDLNKKIISKDWLSWIEKLGKNKHIGKIDKKKIYSGAELIAEDISKRRAFEINKKIDNLSDNNELTSSWKMKEQKITLEKIGKKLSSMSLNEIIEIYNKYGKKEVVKKKQ